MQAPERFRALPDHFWSRLRALLDAHEPGSPDPIDMTIGEPRHAYPAFVEEIMGRGPYGRYPSNPGTDELLGAASDWIARRHGARVAPDRLMALNGTREGLFAAALAMVPEQTGGRRSAVLIPDPFYQVYAVGAAAAGAEPVYLPCTEGTGFLPDFDAVPAETLARTTAVYLCTPSNPQGAVASEDYLRDLLELAERHGFAVLSDECYSEIYRGGAPAGIVGVAERMGADPERAVMFNSLSKRSSVPGLRSGIMAGGPVGMERVRALRAYAGAPLPGPAQAASARLWADEAHVEASRALYADKLALAEEIFGEAPQAGFFLWLRAPEGDEETALRLWREAGVRVLPGSYLSRGGIGRDRVRVALVADIEEVGRGLRAIAGLLQS